MLFRSSKLRPVFQKTNRPVSIFRVSDRLAQPPQYQRLTQNAHIMTSRPRQKIRTFLCNGRPVGSRLAAFRLPTGYPSHCKTMPNATQRDAKRKTEAGKRPLIYRAVYRFRFYFTPNPSVKLLIIIFTYVQNSYLCTINRQARTVLPADLYPQNNI